jgi:hypothetical protein
MSTDKNLAAVMKEISEKTLVKDSTNPHFKNRYASLDACQEVVLPVLQEAGYTLVNYTQLEQCGDVVMVVLHTQVKKDDVVLCNSSFPVGAVSDKPQVIGAGMTYARRYNLCALFSLTADEDDDGNAASGIKVASPENVKTDVSSKSRFTRSVS